MNRMMRQADSIAPALPRKTGQSPRKVVRSVACTALVGLALLGGAGCDDDTSREFRDAALDSLQQGVSTILDGIVDGAFAVLEVEDDSATARGR
ncbi:MAG: hypothetical protein AB7Q17_01120 [Phycisphaerae bacterium]